MESDFENAKRLVEATIRKVGLDPAACKAPGASEAQLAWTLKRGSASVLVTVTSRDAGSAAAAGAPGGSGTAYLRVASIVVGLPADASTHPALFRKLLELNAAGLANAAFGIIGDRVVVVSERPAANLDEGEVDQTIRHLAAVADTFDDRLEKDFGATRP